MMMMMMVLVVVMMGCLCVAAGELERVEVQGRRGDGSLRFLVVGDWGRKGEFNQSEVAFQMGRVGEALDIDFVVSTGDNFYDDGLSGDHDPNFQESFTRVYTAKSLLHKQWFSVLGNHDYRGDAVAQLSPLLRKIDARWFCRRSFLLAHADQIAELFLVDTTPFVNKYSEEAAAAAAAAGGGGEHHEYDWRGVSPLKTYTANLLKDLESALKESRATWKIVVGHHTIRSVGHHGDTQELVQQLLPILRANNVDLYMNGHDHCLQQISDNISPIQFLTSGAGSKAWRGDVNTTSNNGRLRFFYDGQGFMSVQLTQTNVVATFYDVVGRVLHKWTMSKQSLHPEM